MLDAVEQRIEVVFESNPLDRGEGFRLVLTIIPPPALPTLAQCAPLIAPCTRINTWRFPGVRAPIFSRGGFRSYRFVRSGEVGAMPVVCGADWVLAIEGGGARLSLCATMTNPTPHNTPTSHEMMMAFVSLHIVASTEVTDLRTFDRHWRHARRPKRDQRRLLFLRA
jgi:hypothetical protein